MSLEGKNLYGQYIDYSEKKNGPRASSAPILGLFSISFVYDSSSLTYEKDHHYFLNSADVCW